MHAAGIWTMAGEPQMKSGQVQEQTGRWKVHGCAVRAGHRCPAMGAFSTLLPTFSAHSLPTSAVAMELSLITCCLLLPKE